MNDTRSVFDGILKDVEQLQNDNVRILESKAMDELEAHLTERLTSISENNLEVTATHREALQTLSGKIEELATKMKEQKKKTKNKLEEATEIFDAKL